MQLDATFVQVMASQSINDENIADAETMAAACRIFSNLFNHICLCDNDPLWSLADPGHQRPTGGRPQPDYGHRREGQRIGK